MKTRIKRYKLALLSYFNCITANSVLVQYIVQYNYTSFRQVRLSTHACCKCLLYAYPYSTGITVVTFTRYIHLNVLHKRLRF